MLLRRTAEVCLYLVYSNIQKNQHETLQSGNTNVVSNLIKYVVSVYVVSSLFMSQIKCITAIYYLRILTYYYGDIVI